MTEIQFKSDIDVELIQNMGGDASILGAMLVSTKGGESLEQLYLDTEADGGAAGRINFLR